MRQLATALVLATSLVFCGAGTLKAADRATRSTSVAYVETLAGSFTCTTPLLAQYSSDSGYSSSSRVRIPRGAIKLGIFLIIGLISLCGWVIKRMIS